MLIVNVVIDPANIVGVNYHEQRIVNNLISGKKTILRKQETNSNEVKILRSFLKKTKKDYQVMTIGSSRSMPVNKAAFSKYSYFNNSISSCNLGDMIAIVKILHDNQKLPKLLVLNIDPDYFVLSHYPNNKNLIEDYYSMLNLIGASNQDFSKKKRPLKDEIDEALDLISPRYFQSSFKLLKSELIDKFTKKKAGLENGVIYEDGSRLWEKSLLERKGQAKYDFIMKRTKRMDRFGFRNPQINQENAIIFLKLLGFLKNKGVDFMFLLIPYHKVTHDFERKLIEKPAPPIVENYLHAVAKQNNIAILGSYDPFIAKITEEDLVDHHHPTREYTNKLFSNFSYEL